MTIQEQQQSAIIALMEEKDSCFALLFYTPFCGTCGVAERMLSIVQAAGVPCPIYKTNINYTPLLREQFQIKSVPCLLIVQNGKPKGTIYAMQSVDYLFKELQAIDN